MTTFLVVIHPNFTSWMWLSTSHSRGYVRQAYENFMIGNIKNRKVRRENIVQWMEIGLEKVKVATITRTWAKVGMEIVTTAA